MAAPTTTPGMIRRREFGVGTHQCAADDRNQPDQLADRQVDQAAGDDEGLAEGENGECRRLVEDVDEIVRAAERRYREEADKRERHQAEMYLRGARRKLPDAGQIGHCICSSSN